MSAPPEKKTIKEISSMAANRAMKGGLTGAAAQVVNVLTLMGLRTTMNYQMAKVKFVKVWYLEVEPEELAQKWSSICCRIASSTFCNFARFFLLRVNFSCSL